MTGTTAPTADLLAMAMDLADSDDYAGALAVMEMVDGDEYDLIRTELRALARAAA